MKSLLRRFVVIMATGAAALFAVVTTADATLAPVVFRGHEITQATAIRYLYGDNPSDTQLRSVYFSRAGGVLTIRMHVNRTDAAKRWGKNGLRDIDALVYLVANRRIVGSALVNNYPDGALTARPTFNSCSGPVHTIAGGIDYRANTFVFQIPLSSLTRCVPRGTLVTMTGDADLSVFLYAAHFADWISYFRGPEFSFRY